jgi:hypothetical protein
MVPVLCGACPNQWSYQEVHPSAWPTPPPPKKKKKKKKSKHILLQWNFKSCGQLRQCIENQVNFTYNYVLKLPLIMTLIL